MSDPAPEDGTGEEPSAEASEPKKRRRWPWLLGLFMSFLFGRCTAGPPPDQAVATAPLPTSAQAVPEPPRLDPQGRRFGPCSVTSVSNGQKLDVFCGAFGNSGLRLLYVKAPGEGEPEFWDAGRILARKVHGQEIFVELHGEPVRDEDGRLVLVHGYVFIEDRNLNVEMVRLGWSRYVDPDSTSFYAEEFLQAVAKAETDPLHVLP